MRKSIIISFKKASLFSRGILFCTLNILTGCIETDLEDPFPETLRIIDPEERVFRVSGQYELMAEYTDDTGELADVPVAWSSSDPDILQIINGNIAKGIAAGTVLLSASVKDMVDTLTVEVLGSHESINISMFVRSLQIGSSVTFGINYIDVSGVVQDVDPVWKSLDETIATVNGEGTVTGVSVGMATIKASFGNVSDQVMLEVVADEPVSMDPEIQITTFKEFMEEGETFMFEAVYLGTDGQPDNTVSPEWASSNPGVLTIGSTTGNVTAVSAGQAMVMASFEGVSAALDVTVEVATAPDTERTGTLMGRGYNISGSFTLKHNEAGDLILKLENYVPAGPDPHFYLSNQSENVNNGLGLGIATTAGNVEINVSQADSSVELNTYDYLVIWCKQFGVLLGYGQFEN